MEENEGANILETSPVSNGPWYKVRTYPPSLPITENIISFCCLQVTSENHCPRARLNTTFASALVNNFRNSLEQGCAKD